jgi:hypothetical protein
MRAKDHSEFITLASAVTGVISKPDWLRNFGVFYHFGIAAPTVKVSGILEHGDIVLLQTVPRRQGLIPQVPVSWFDLGHQTNAALKDLIVRTKAEYSRKQVQAKTRNPGFASHPAQTPHASASSS